MNSTRPTAGEAAFPQRSGRGLCEGRLVEAPEHHVGLSSRHLDVVAQFGSRHMQQRRKAFSRVEAIQQADSLFQSCHAEVVGH